MKPAIDTRPAGPARRWFDSGRIAAALTVVLLATTMPAPAAAPSHVDSPQRLDSAAYDITCQNPSGPWTARNPAQGFRAEFGDGRIEVMPEGSLESMWKLGMRLIATGDASEMRPVAAAAPHAEGNRVEFGRGAITEWYVNGDLGLEQGFTLWEPPPTRPSMVYLDIELAGELLPKTSERGKAIDLIMPGARFPALCYGGLKVSDADGAELQAALEIVPGGAESARHVRIIVHAAGARFPLEIDPLLTSASWSSAESEITLSVDWGDWDGDGDLDMAVGNYSESNRVYENVGGALSPVWSSVETDNTYSVAWGDWDGDGDLDLAVGNYNQVNRVYEKSGGLLILNPGAGYGWSSGETDNTLSVAWGDWDGDGDLDLAVGNYLEPNRVYENEGGTLALNPGAGLGWDSTLSDGTYSVAWGDWDGDSDLDLAVGNYDQANRVYENDGGTLSLNPGSGLGWSSGETDYTLSVAWGDWDGDGDFDLAVGNYGQANRVYENSGGTLNLDPGTGLGWSSAELDDTIIVAWGDQEGDGDLDLAAGNDGANRVYENDGLGNSDSLVLVWSSTETDATWGFTWGDRDGDGDLDMAAANYGQPNRVYENSGGFPPLAWSSALTQRPTRVAWGDWDGDGDLDLAAQVRNAQIYENDGGSLSLTWSSTESPTCDGPLAWGDWDGDGDLDLAVGSACTSSVPNRVYENDGGSLTAAWSSLELDSTHSVAWGDWDGDGDLDLAAGNSGQQNHVYENAGGTLQLDPGGGLGWSSTGTETTESIAWGDWDGDGDLDLAAGNFGQANVVYENDGGALQLNPGSGLGWISTETDATRAVAWGDWDGDGDLDLAVGNHGANRLYENDGLGQSGSLTLVWSSAESDFTSDVAWGDWDGDGDLDLAAANDIDTATRLYENDGMGLATSLSLAASSAEEESSASLAWGDRDGDGDLDLAVGNLNYTSLPAIRVYDNGRVTRPASLPESPTYPVALDRPGTTDSAYFFSSAEYLFSPIAIPYTLFDEQSDSAWSIVPEYSLTGGGQWLPATQGSGGEGTFNLSASPGGTQHIFSWDAESDLDDPARVTFRITVVRQAPDHVGYPLQQGGLAAVTPPFRVDPCMPTLEITGLRFGKSGDLIAADWDASSDPCITNYAMLGAGSLAETFSTEAETTGLETTVTFDTTSSFFVVVGKSGVTNGPTGH